MNYFIENLDKQEKILAAINVSNNNNLNNNSLEFNDNNQASYFNGDLTENYNQNFSLDNNNNNLNYKTNNSEVNDPAASGKKDDFDYQENKINSINLNNLNETDNLFLMILHRSLYILKKKFELHKSEINSIYEEHSEKKKFNKILNTDNFIGVLHKIFKTCKVNFLDINQPSDLFKAEIIENYSEEKLRMIEKHIKSFMLRSRKYYNDRFKYKREKEFYEIFLKEKVAVTNSLKKLDTENTTPNVNTISNAVASENPTPKNPAANSKPGVSKKTSSVIKNNNLIEGSGGVNNPNNVSLNESRISKANNDPKKRESNVNNSTLKNSKAKKKDDSVISGTKNNNSKKPVSRQVSSKSLLGNEKQVEDDQDVVNDVENNVDNSSANLLQEDLHVKNNIDNNKNPNVESFGVEKDIQEGLAAEAATKSSKNDLDFAADNIEDFRIKKLDDEIKTVILDDANNSELNLKLNKHASQENFVKYIIADAIPLIIADFIHENINIALLEMSDDLKSDLRGLFDKEIIKKIEEASQYDTEKERVLKLKEYLFEKLNTQKNIKTYEDLFLMKKTQGENTSHIINILFRTLTSRISIITALLMKRGRL